jgi:hypothetical protein
MFIKPKDASQHSLAFILLHFPEIELVLKSTCICSQHLHSHKSSGSYTADANVHVATAVCMVAVELFIITGILEGTERTSFLGRSVGRSVGSCCSRLEHRASVKRFVSLQFLNLRHSIGLLGRVISTSQGR